MLVWHSPMQAITTKVFGATNHRPARITAEAAAGSLTVSWEAACNGCGESENGDNGVHAFVVEKLIKKLGWANYAQPYFLVSAIIPGTYTRLWTFVSKEHAKTLSN